MPKELGALRSSSSRNAAALPWPGERYGSDVTDFRSQLTKLLRADPDALHTSAPVRVRGGDYHSNRHGSWVTRAPIYAETISVGTTALEVAGEAATGHEGHYRRPGPRQQEGAGGPGQLPESATTTSRCHGIWGQRTTTCTIAAECLKQTNDDQDADGFRDCMYGITWSGAIGDNYSFDANGEVRGSLKGGRGGPACGRADPKRGSTRSSGRRQGRKTLRPAPGPAAGPAHQTGLNRKLLRGGPFGGVSGGPVPPGAEGYANTLDDQKP